MTVTNERDQKRDRGQLRIDEEECKGCGLCIEACPPKVIGMSERMNHYGYRTALYAGAGCTGCGICFMVCPEPGAITVLRLANSRTVAATHPSPAQGARLCASN
jgi:2-oxoglutarate ferredoxin oxidoreductase subunit delta